MWATVVFVCRTQHQGRVYFQYSHLFLEAGGRPEFPSVVQPTTYPEPAIEAVPTKEGGTCT